MQSAVRTVASSARRLSPRDVERANGRSTSRWLTEERRSPLDRISDPLASKNWSSESSACSRLARAGPIRSQAEGRRFESGFPLQSWQDPSGESAPRKPRSRYYDGAPWGWLIDPLTSGVQDFVAEKVGAGARVVDVGCGTGLLALRLAQRAAEVVGLELSPAMVAYANRRLAAAAAPNVTFVLGDAAAHLAARPDGAFDTATMAFVLHEMPAEARGRVLRESARVAGRVVCVEYMVPMPRSARGLFYRGLEMAAGPEHYRGFRDFGKRGGTPGVAASAGLRCRRLGAVLGACVDVSEVRR